MEAERQKNVEILSRKARVFTASNDSNSTSIKPQNLNLNWKKRLWIYTSSIIGGIILYTINPFKNSLAITFFTIIGIEYLILIELQNKRKK